MIDIPRDCGPMPDLMAIPQHPEAEQGFLGCVLQGAFDRAVEAGVDAEFFHDARCRAVWGVCEKLASEGLEVSVMNVATRLDDHAMFLMELPDKGPTASNLGFWHGPLRETALRRRVWRTHYDALVEVARGADVEELQRHMQQALFSACAPGKTKDKKEALKAYAERLEKAYPSGLPKSGPTTGLHNLDALYGRFEPESMNVIAARPGRGKTAFAVNLMVKAIRSGVPVAMWSFEMGWNQVMDRMLANLTGEDVKHYLETGQGEAQRIVRGVMEFSGMKFHIEDRVDTTVFQIRSQARRYAKEGYGLFVVDYLQLVPGGGSTRSRNDEVGVLSRELKKAAMETGVPFVVLSQMNREVSKTDRRPVLSDLRDSGNIEQDADTVGFLHCKDDEMEKGEHDIDFILRKNRHGKIGTARLHWTKWNNKFYEVSNTATI